MEIAKIIKIKGSFNLKYSESEQLENSETSVQVIHFMLDQAAM